MADLEGVLEVALALEVDCVAALAAWVFLVLVVLLTGVGEAKTSFSISLKIFLMKYVKTVKIGRLSFMGL